MRISRQRRASRSFTVAARRDLRNQLTVWGLARSRSPPAARNQHRRRGTEENSERHARPHPGPPPGRGRTNCRGGRESSGSAVGASQAERIDVGTARAAPEFSRRVATISLSPGAHLYPYLFRWTPWVSKPPSLRPNGPSEPSRGLSQAMPWMPSARELVDAFHG